MHFYKNSVTKMFLFIYNAKNRHNLKVNQLEIG